MACSIWTRSLNRPRLATCTVVLIPQFRKRKIQRLETLATNALFQVVLVPTVKPTPPTPEAANTAYVASLYQQCAQRAADPTAAAWVALLNNGASPQSVVLGIENSPEYLSDQVTAATRNT